MNDDLIYLVDTGTGLLVEDLFMSGDMPKSVILTLSKDAAWHGNDVMAFVMADMVERLGLTAKVVIA